MMHPSDDGFLAPFLATASHEPGRAFARFSSGDVTFGDLDRRSAVLAGRLATEGARPGDLVAVMLRNSPLTLAMMLALARAGLVWVPINVAGRGENLAYILDHSAPRIVVAEDDLVATIRDSGATLAGATLVAASRLALPSSFGGSSGGSGSDASIAADAPYAIMYTSGTTGRPKGVVVTHRMLRLSAEAVVLVSAAEAGDVLYVWEPLFHIGGAQLIALPALAEVTLAFSERFSASRFWNEAKAYGATHIHFLGGILQLLLKQPETPLDRSHGVRIAWGGGCPREVWRPFEARFGVTIRECYGMTECSSITTANLDGTVGAVGRPVPWLDVTIRRPDGTLVAMGERGEIVVREKVAGAVTRSYLRNPDATTAVLRGGDFFTGDLGTWGGDGNMIFHGRMTDSVRVRGENVSAAEVEGVAAKHPDVEDCAVVGVAAEIGEQEIKLLVVPRAGARIDPPALSAWLAARLAPYQLPRYIAVVEAFERTPSLRIMKHKLSRSTDDAWDRAAATSPPSSSRPPPSQPT